MHKIGRRHNFRVLREKPFAGVNGSKTQQLVACNEHRKKSFVARKTPKTNLFLTFFINVKAFHDNADLLRATIASAVMIIVLEQMKPPAIMSVFLGLTIRCFG